MSDSKTNNSKLLSDCESYMLTNLNLLKYYKNSSRFTDYSDVYTKTIIKTALNINKTSKSSSNKKSTKHIEEKTIDKFTEIIEKDKLFWCFYILKYGYDEYIHSTKRFSIEKQEKISAIQEIKKNKNLLKKLKLKKSEIETDLLNSETISLQSFFALCVYNNINCFIVDGRKYYEISNDMQEKCENKLNYQYNIIYKKNKDYSINVSLTNEDIQNKIQTYRSNYYKIENLNKPIKAFSTYSLSDLITICENLQISVTNNDGKKLIKKEMYSEILKHFD